MDTITEKQSLDFGPDKSQILRGIAIIFMIILHNTGIIEFKICVPIFTFLVGYGYNFAKKKNIVHAVQRSWHLLSHFWLILLGLFLPVAIWGGEFHPTIKTILPELFGLDSQLNWYSWYVYFYIFAMVMMIPAHKIIQRWGLWGIGCLIILCIGGCFSIHSISGWSENIWLQAGFDCCLVSPPMFTGFYIAEKQLISKIKFKSVGITLLGSFIIGLLVFFMRGLPYAGYLDFLSVPMFCLSTILIFQILNNKIINGTLISLGKESMNMWFFHAIFFTSVTASVFYPLVEWLSPISLRIIVMIIASYVAGKIFTYIYSSITK